MNNQEFVINQLALRIAQLEVNLAIAQAELADEPTAIPPHGEVISEWYRDNPVSDEDEGIHNPS